MWLVVAGIMLGLVVFVWLVLSLLPDSSGGGDSAESGRRCRLPARARGERQLGVGDGEIGQRREQ